MPTSFNARLLDFMVRKMGCCSHFFKRYFCNVVRCHTHCVFGNDSQLLSQQTFHICEIHWVIVIVGLGNTDELWWPSWIGRAPKIKHIQMFGKAWIFAGIKFLECPANHEKNVNTGWALNNNNQTKHTSAKQLAATRHTLLHSELLEGRNAVSVDWKFVRYIVINNSTWELKSTREKNGIPYRTVFPVSFILPQTTS